MPADRKGKVVRRYDRWSGFYDFVDSIPPMGAMEKRWRREAIRMLDVRPDSRVLDMGTGSGMILPWLAEPIAGGKVVGTDLSLKMLEVAKARVERAGCAGKVELAEDDCETSKFPEASFDRAITTFTLTSVPEPEKAVSELARLLKPGGKGVVLDHGRPTSLLLRALFPYIAAVARLFGYTYLKRDIRGMLERTPCLKITGEKRFFGGMVYAIAFEKRSS